jgi:hypothetical protein
MKRSRVYVEAEGIEKKVDVIEEWRFLQKHDEEKK